MLTVPTVLAILILVRTEPSTFPKLEYLHWLASVTLEAYNRSDIPGVRYLLHSLSTVCLSPRTMASFHSCVPIVPRFEPIYLHTNFQLILGLSILTADHQATVCECGMNLLRILLLALPHTWMRMLVFDLGILVHSSLAPTSASLCWIVSGYDVMALEFLHPTDYGARHFLPTSSKLFGR